MHNEDDAIMITRPFLFKLYLALTETLLFHEWLKKGKYLKTDFIILPNSHDSKASRRIKTFLESFKDVFKRGGNGLKTPKFHQMLHVCDYIQRHGSPLNYDGSRGENFGKVKIKDNAKLTRKQKGAFNFDIGHRISEEDLIDSTSSIFQNNKGYWPSEFCNDTDISLDANRIQNTPFGRVGNKKSVNDTPRYTLICTIENIENDNDVTEEVNVHIDWGGQSRTPVMSYPQELLKSVAARLYIGSPNIGGKIVCPSTVNGYTGVTLNGNIYRCHPFYGNTGSWYDWAFFRWEGFDCNIPAKILMILDLTECEICEDVDISPDQTDTTSHAIRIPHLTQEKWVVVKAAESSSILSSELTDDHFVNDIITRIKIDEDRIWLIPLSSLVDPCYVVYNFNYCERQNENDICEHDSTAFVIKSVKEWSNLFIY